MCSQLFKLTKKRLNGSVFVFFLVIIDNKNATSTWATPISIAEMYSDTPSVEDLLPPEIENENNMNTIDIEEIISDETTQTEDVLFNEPIDTFDYESKHIGGCNESNSVSAF